jgi:hypothetical protein
MNKDFKKDLHKNLERGPIEGKEVCDLTYHQLRK